MFRNHRENSSSSSKASLKPSTGRPPTPPNGTQEPRVASTMTTRDSTKPLTPRLSFKSNVPTLGRQGTKKAGNGKALGKPNGNILNFFKKVDSPLKDDSIFLSQGSQSNGRSAKARSPSIDHSDTEFDDVYCDNDNGSVDSGRYNEAAGSIKRRKVSNGSSQIGLNTKDHISIDIGDTETSGNSIPPVVKTYKPPPPNASTTKPTKPRRTGPFLEDSDTDEELEDSKIQNTAIEAEKKELEIQVSRQPKSMSMKIEARPVKQEQMKENRPLVSSLKSVSSSSRNASSPSQAEDASIEHLYSRELPPRECGKDINDIPFPPALKNDETSMDEFGDFDDLEGFPDDDFPEGEEFAERKWMEEQAMLEAPEEGEEGEEGQDDIPFEGFDDSSILEVADEITAACPVCSASLGGITTDHATRHVNGCLDGKPIPLSGPIKVEPSKLKLMPAAAKNRFSKAAIARPGQEIPFEIGNDRATSSSAFSKLMSSKAEDTAWAAAAAAENASRGKPAYQRTCPFYKIMPGFFICVDAFRYGAVQGCNAYFLSHFHSDHYIGLTSSWCHGPIYCSKVTANLVRQQLRVDPEWVVALEFEERFEVPGTQGVAVTMIPANHCPGSSLYLFEKVIGKGANPKIQRVLHCGDFRACPAHIAHPLLMPDIVDSINGKTKQQNIDVCYLDTTYLNPRYAFPSQEDVITACADMCVSLKKERAEESDAWEKVKKERAGTGMTKFVKSTLKSEDDSMAMEISNAKPRGRLLVVCGTYSIGKERICMGIANALDCKIWAPPGKMRICAALEDPELMSRMTDDPKKAQIHMQMLMEIRPETLQDYLNGFKPHFSRIVGFRPSGWNYRPPNSRFTDSPSIPTILYSLNWKSRYTMAELVPQRGSTREASCFGVPYSEHSSFRELAMFVCALRIEKVVPTVNVGSTAGRAKMKGWIERWLTERRKNGPVKFGDGEGECRW